MSTFRWSFKLKKMWSNTVELEAPHIRRKTSISYLISWNSSYRISWNCLIITDACLPSIWNQRFKDNNNSCLTLRTQFTKLPSLPSQPNILKQIWPFLLRLKWNNLSHVGEATWAIYIFHGIPQYSAPYKWREPKKNCTSSRALGKLNSVIAVKCIQVW